MLWAPNPIATPTTPGAGEQRRQVDAEVAEDDDAGDREDGDRRHAPQDRPEGANPLLAALVDQGPLGLGGGAVDLALAAPRRPTPSPRRGPPPRPGSSASATSASDPDVPPPSPDQPAPGARRAAAAPLRRFGRREWVARSVSRLITRLTMNWMIEREHHDEDDPQQQVDRPVEEFGRQLRRVLVVRQVPDQLAGHARIGGAAGEQRRRGGIHAERRYLNTDHHADPSRDPIRNYATPARLPAPRACTRRNA